VDISTPTATEWFVYTQRERTECYPRATRRQLIAGPYETCEAADKQHYRAIAALEKAPYKGVAWCWFWTWGVCEMPVGTGRAVLGRLD